MYNRPLYKGEKKAVCASIEKVIAETPSNCFDKWWMDVFDTEVYCNTEEDFASLSETDLDIMMNDWLCAVLGDFSGQVLRDLGIECCGSSRSNSRLVEEICDLTKEALRNRIRGTQPVAEVTVSLPKTMDVYNLFVLLGNIETSLKLKNSKHREMIAMLEGNESNEAAKRNLDISTNALRSNNTNIELIQNIRAQIEPFLDEVLNSPA